MMTKNELVTIALCTNLVSNNANHRPYTAIAWTKLISKIIQSEIKEPKNLHLYTKNQLSEILNISEDEAIKVIDLLTSGVNLAFALDKLKNMGIKVLTRSNERYPKILKTKLKRKSPPVLFYSGNLDLLESNSLGIVGSRNPAESEKSTTRLLVEKAIKEDKTIVSGGAKGIDTISETHGIKLNGKIISVVSNTLSKKIQDKNIRNHIMKDKMLVLSDVNPGMHFNVASAMRRNKYIYSLANLTFVMAAKYNEGGTWNGAIENLKSQWSKTYVYKDSSHLGNKELIRLGGIPFTKEDIKSFTFDVKNKDEVIQPTLF